MFDMPLEEVIFRIIAVLPLVAIHGFAMAAFARVLGDRGVGYDGRLSINPVRHFDAIGAIGLVLLRIGWSKPVAVDPKELRWGRAGLVAIAAASLLATLAVVFLILLLRPVVLSTVGEPEIARTIIAILDELAELTAGLVILNLLPLPPLTGGLVLQAIAPQLFETLTARRLPVSLALAAGLFLLVYFDRAGVSSVIRAVAALLLNTG